MVVLGRPIFYGWIVTAACFLATGTGFGVIYTFGAYFESFSREFGANRQSVGLVYTLANSLLFGLGIVAGPLVDRIGPRRLCLVGAVFLLVGLGLASRATELWQVYLTFGLGAGCGGAAVYVPATGTVQRWFIRHRATASGIVSAGIGVALILTPALSSASIQALGWRSTLLLTAGISAGCLIVAAFFVRRAPADLGLWPDGAAHEESSPAVRNEAISAAGLAQMLRSSTCVLIYLALLGFSAPAVFIQAHLVPYARDAGLDPVTAASGLSAIGLGNVGGRLALAPIADRYGRRPAYTVSVALLTGITALWLVLPIGWVWPLLVFGFCLGTAQGGFVALTPTVVADYFGTRLIGSILGLIYPAFAIGSLIGPWLGGLIFDTTGSYRGAILASVALLALSTTATMLLPNAQASRHTPPGS